MIVLHVTWAVLITSVAGAPAEPEFVELLSKLASNYKHRALSDFAKASSLKALLVPSFAISKEDYSKRYHRIEPEEDPVENHSFKNLDDGIVEDIFNVTLPYGYLEQNEALLVATSLLVNLPNKFTEEILKQIGKHLPGAEKHLEAALKQAKQHATTALNAAKRAQQRLVKALDKTDEYARELDRKLWAKVEGKVDEARDKLHAWKEAGLGKGQDAKLPFLTDKIKELWRSGEVQRRLEQVQDQLNRVQDTVEEYTDEVSRAMERMLEEGIKKPPERITHMKPEVPKQHSNAEPTPFEIALQDGYDAGRKYLSKVRKEVKKFLDDRSERGKRD